MFDETNERNGYKAIGYDEASQAPGSRPSVTIPSGYQAINWQPTETQDPFAPPAFNEDLTTQVQQATLCHRLQHATAQLFEKVSSSAVEGMCWEMGSQFAARYFGTGMNPSLGATGCSLGYTGYAIAGGVGSCAGTVFTLSIYSSLMVYLARYRPNAWLTRICVGDEHARTLREFISEKGMRTTIKAALVEIGIYGVGTLISDSAWQPIFDGISSLVVGYVQSSWKAQLIVYGGSSLLCTIAFVIVVFIIRAALEKAKLQQPFNVRVFREALAISYYDSFWVSAGFFTDIFSVFESSSVCGDILYTGLQSAMGATMGDLLSGIGSCFGRKVGIKSLADIQRVLPGFCQKMAKIMMGEKDESMRPLLQV